MVRFQYRIELRCRDVSHLRIVTESFYLDSVSQIWDIPILARSYLRYVHLYGNYKSFSWSSSSLRCRKRIVWSKSTCILAKSCDIGERGVLSFLGKLWVSSFSRSGYSIWASTVNRWTYRKTNLGNRTVSTVYCYLYFCYPQRSATNKDVTIVICTCNTNNNFAQETLTKWTQCKYAWSRVTLIKRPIN